MDLLVWGNLRVDDEAFQIPGFQPDLVSFVKRFKTSSRAGAHDLSCKLMSGEGFVAGGGEGFKAGFYGGDRGVGDHQRKGAGFVSHHEVERGLAGDRVRAVIVGKFCVGDRLGP